jgi:hypothetical protein
MGKENVGAVLAKTRAEGVSIALGPAAGAATTDDPVSCFDFRTQRQALQRVNNKKGNDATSRLMRS